MMFLSRFNYLLAGYKNDKQYHYLLKDSFLGRKESFRALNIDNSLLNKNNSKEKVIKFILSKKTMCSLKLKNSHFHERILLF